MGESENLPRQLIARITEVFNNHDLIDRWDYSVQVGRDFRDFIKSGQELSQEKNFLAPSKFSRMNSISATDLYYILFPVFVETRELLVGELYSRFDHFLIRLKYQIQTNHAKAIYALGKPKEDYGRNIVSAAVFGFFSHEGFVYHEVPSGKGLIDILICNDREIIVETKLHTNFDPLSHQLSEYICAGSNRYGYYFVFDTTRSFTHKKFCDIENNRFPNPNRYATIVCHINPPKPSSV